jgi:hypothetical protein
MTTCARIPVISSSFYGEDPAPLKVDYPEFCWVICHEIDFEWSLTRSEELHLPNSAERKDVKTNLRAR